MNKETKRAKVLLYAFDLGYRIDEFGNVFNPSGNLINYSLINKGKKISTLL